MPLQFDEYNQAVTEWMNDTRTSFASKANSYGISHRSNSPSSGSSLAKIKGRATQRDGLVSKVGYTFPRTLIWTHKGAGKGRGGAKGSRWLDKYGASQHTNPKSLNKMGTGGRTAKPFFNDVLEGEKGIDELATIAAEKLGDTITGNLLIK